MNNLKHGAHSSILILPTEDEAEFHRLHSEAEQFYQPQSTYQHDLVDQMVGAKWKLRRADAFEAALLLAEVNLEVPSSIFAYTRINQTQAHLRRTWHKLAQELEKIKAARPNQSPKPADQPAPTVTPEVTPTAPPPEPQEEWATPEEWERQTGTEKNYKRAERLEFCFPGRVPGEHTATRLYRGKHVDKFPPCDNPNCANCYPVELPDTPPDENA